jgi:hypothetical protein
LATTKWKEIMKTITLTPKEAMLLKNMVTLRQKKWERFLKDPEVTQELKDSTEYEYAELLALQEKLNGQG